MSSAAQLLVPDQIRPQFPLLEQEANGHPLAYLDNAATSQKPQQVIEAVNNYYRANNANVHRGIYDLGSRSTDAYEGARHKIAKFIGASDWRSVIFTGGTTEAINLVAASWGRANLTAGDEIVLSESEHHSNLVPWQLIAKQTGATLRHIPLGPHQGLDMEAAEKLITAKTRMVAVGHQSNALGNINPVEKIIEMAKSVGAVTLIDGAQAAPHFSIDVEALGCDFYSFSGHKMLGPTGVGVLYGRLELLEAMPPFMGGGEMIHSVTLTDSTWNELPWKFEAGTPNIAQAVGLGAAVDYIESLGMARVTATIDALSAYAVETLAQIDGLTLFGDAATRSAALSFAMEGVHPHDMAQLLDQEGIAVRAGHHCTQPLMQVLGVGSTTRASFQIYNTRDEIDRLGAAIVAAGHFMRGA